MTDIMADTGRKRLIKNGGRRQLDCQPAMRNSGEVEAIQTSEVDPVAAVGWIAARGRSSPGISWDSRTHNGSLRHIPQLERISRKDGVKNLIVSIFTACRMTRQVPGEWEIKMSRETTGAAFATVVERGCKL